MSENNTELIIYQTEDGRTKIDVHMENETVWLSLEQMSELFQRDKSTISRHIKNVFADGELLEEATVANFATVQMEAIERLPETLRTIIWMSSSPLATGSSPCVVPNSVSGLIPFCGST